MRRKTRYAVLSAALWLGIWVAAAALVGQSLLLPSPLETARALLSLAGTGAFWASVLGSVARVCAGFLTGLLLGSLLAVLTASSAWWHAFFRPFLSAVKATPVASFIVLALVWIRTDGVPVFATALVVLPVVWSNVSAGIAATDADLLEMARAFRIGRQRTVTAVYWPSVGPYLRAALTAGMGMAWKAGVAAEVIAMPRLSLGSRLYESKVYLDTPGLFAATAAIILLSILLERAVCALLARTAKEAPDG